jgi:hypothetical protein
MDDAIHYADQLEDRPRSLRDINVRERRKGMLHLPHIAALTNYAATLRQRGVGVVPDFDPLDGGIDAKLLFLLEKPGPMTSEARGGSGFISRNNDDRTAEAIFDFMTRARIDRKLAVIWNVIPWWNDTRRVAGAELRACAACVLELIQLLPSLTGVVMVGSKAGKARQYLERTNLALFSSHHPSPLVKATAPGKWDAIPAQWAQAALVLTRNM